MKTCTLCKITKPMSDYYARKERNSVRSKCKECCKSDNISTNKKYRANKTQHELAQIQGVTDRYVIQKLKKDNAPITDETIELKRLSIITHRLCQRSKN